MVKQKKRCEAKKTEYELYVVDIENWEISYDFHASNETLKKLYPGDYHETKTLTFLGKIVWPRLKNVRRVKIDITEVQELDKFLMHKSGDNLPTEIGFIDIPKNGDILWVMCSVPAQAVTYILTAVSSGQIRRASVCGSKLEEGRGSVTGMNLITRSEE